MTSYNEYARSSDNMIYYLNIYDIDIQTVIPYAYNL